jgi:hypothetical protein
MGSQQTFGVVGLQYFLFWILFVVFAIGCFGYDIIGWVWVPEVWVVLGFDKTKMDARMKWKNRNQNKKTRNHI